MLKKSAEGSFGYISLKGSDVQNIDYISLFSGVCYDGNGSCITPTTFEQCLTIGGVRSMIKKTWLNENNQFQAPKGYNVKEVF